MNDSRKADARQAIMACGDDGIWDISLGAILLLFGAILFLAWHTVCITAVLLVIPLAIIAKHMITLPRLRQFETRTAPGGRIGMAVIILSLATLAVIGLLAVLIWTDRRDLIPDWAAGLLPIFLPVTLALLAVVIMGTAGMMVDAAGRYFLYAGILAASFLALLWESTPDWITLIVPGLFMVIVGLGCAVRFLTTHPLVPRDHHLRYEF